jgi:putative transcriptional regulator
MSIDYCSSASTGLVALGGDCIAAAATEPIRAALKRTVGARDKVALDGHAGWAPGQLEAEIERHDWTSKRAEMEAIFKPLDFGWPN